MAQYEFGKIVNLDDMVFTYHEEEVMEPTDKFTYDVYAEPTLTAGGNPWIVWHVDIKLRATGERVHQTVAYNYQGDAVEAALDWMDENVDNEDM